MSENLKAVILAGGVGKRLRPLTEYRPKPLIPVAGRPCIDFVIRSLVSGGFKEIIVTTGYLSDRLIKRIGDGSQYGATILYSFEEEPMGTAGAVKKVADFLDDTFVVASGDLLADIDMGALYKYHKDKEAMATMALTKVSDPIDFGIVGLNKTNKIIKFAEKPEKKDVFSNLINAGIYVLEPEILDIIPEDTPYDFSKQVFPTMLENEQALYGKMIKGIWRDIGKPMDLLQASLDVVDREGAKVKIEKVRTKGNIIIGKNTAIEKGVKIIGPAYIGDDVYVSSGTVIDKSCIYDSVFVDREATIKNSIILDGSKVGWQSTIVNSVISRDCQIEEDVTITSSVIGDKMTVKIHSKLEDANLTLPPDNNNNSR
ncbi:MAG: NDP-sugar synthase [Thermoplasmata archaeon]|nr:NDP-sugar synthase [Thermoplasmata archaeon]